MIRRPQWVSTLTDPRPPGCPGRCAEKLEERALEGRLFRTVRGVGCGTNARFPDWAGVHADATARTDVTLALLWHEYKAVHPEGLQYSQCLRIATERGVGASTS